MGRSVRRRAEDRKPSKRVFPLLQNLDLDNVTFDQVQGVGDPISIEDMNEQEMLDLIIVNLARLCVKSEWDGLLESGGGGGGYATAIIEVFTGSTGALVYRIPAQSLGGTIANWNQAVGCYMMPFVGTDDATIDAMQIYGATTNGTTTLAGVYSTTDEGLPDTKLTEGSLTTDSVGLITQTSLTGTFTMEKGENYWLAWIIDHASQQYATIRYSVTVPTSPLPALTVYGGGGGYTAAVLYDASVSSLPTSFTMSGFQPSFTGDVSVPLIGLRTS